MSSFPLFYGVFSDAGEAGPTPVTTRVEGVDVPSDGGDAQYGKALAARAMKNCGTVPAAMTPTAERTRA